MTTTHQPARAQSERRGFTLIEVIIAVSILAFILSISYGALRAITSSKKLLDDQRDLRSIADVVLVRLVREIQLASPGDPLLPRRDNLDEKVPSSIVLRGTRRELTNSRRGDTISFIARAGGQYLADGSGNTGMVQITFRVEEDPEARSSESPLYLVREEVPYINPAETAYKRSIVFPISNALEHFELRYLAADTKSWAAEWGTEQRTGLPAAVEITLAVRSPQGRIERFSTTIPLRRTE